MKVKIGPYLTWYGPYQIADYVFFWTKRRYDDELERWDYKLKDQFGDWLADAWVGTFCNWIHEKRKRTEIVRIDPYDTWSMDHTLSLIIHPMLVQLRDTKHGAPFTDDQDVPEHLRSTSAPLKKEEWDTDDLFQDRWNWILDEIIWAFYQEANDDPDAPEFPEIGKSIVKEIESDSLGLGLTSMLCAPKGSQEVWDKYYADSAEFDKRKDNAFRLFGKYYRGLWD
jgi:hypothetical protein